MAAKQSEGFEAQAWTYLKNSKTIESTGNILTKSILNAQQALIK